MIRIATILLLVAAFSAPAQADDIACYGSDSHFAVFVKQTEDLDSYVYFGEREYLDAPIPCGADSMDLAFLKAGESIDQFFGLFGNLAVTGSSTDPFTIISVFELPKTEPIYSVWALDYVVGPGGIVFFEETDTPATPETCPEYENFTMGGMSAIMAEQKLYDLETKEVQSLGEMRCFQTP